MHQELSVTSSLNDIQNRTQIQSSPLEPSSMLMTLRGRTEGPGLVRFLNRVTQSAPEDANSGTILVLTLREVRVLQSEYLPLNLASETERHKVTSQNPLLDFFSRHKMLVNGHRFSPKLWSFHPQMKAWYWKSTPLMKKLKNA